MTRIALLLIFLTACKENESSSTSNRNQEKLSLDAAVSQIAVPSTMPGPFCAAIVSKEELRQAQETLPLLEKNFAALDKLFEGTQADGRGWHPLRSNQSPGKISLDEISACGVGMGTPKQNNVANTPKVFDEQLRSACRFWMRDHRANALKALILDITKEKDLALTPAILTAGIQQLKTCTVITDKEPYPNYEPVGSNVPTGGNCCFCTYSVRHDDKCKAIAKDTECNETHECIWKAIVVKGGSLKNQCVNVARAYCEKDVYKDAFRSVDGSECNYKAVIGTRTDGSYEGTFPYNQCKYVSVVHGGHSNIEDNLDRIYKMTLDAYAANKKILKRVEFDDEGCMGFQNPSALETFQKDFVQELAGTSLETFQAKGNTLCSESLNDEGMRQEIRAIEPKAPSGWEYIPGAGSRKSSTPRLLTWTKGKPDMSLKHPACSLLYNSPLCRPGKNSQTCGSCYLIDMEQPCSEDSIKSPVMCYLP